MVLTFWESRNSTIMATGAQAMLQQQLEAAVMQTVVHAEAQVPLILSLSRMCVCVCVCVCFKISNILLILLYQIDEQIKKLDGMDKEELEEMEILRERRMKQMKSKAQKRTQGHGEYREIGGAGM